MGLETWTKAIKNQIKNQFTSDVLCVHQAKSNQNFWTRRKIKKQVFNCQFLVIRSIFHLITTKIPSKSSRGQREWSFRWILMKMPIWTRQEMQPSMNSCWCSKSSCSVLNVINMKGGFKYTFLVRANTTKLSHASEKIGTGSYIVWLIISYSNYTQILRRLSS